MLARQCYCKGNLGGSSSTCRRGTAALAGLRQQCKQQQQQHGRVVVLRSASAQGSSAAADPEVDEVAAETAVRVGWDPHGLLPPVEGPVDHFARRARQRQQNQAVGQEEQPQPQQEGPQQATEAAAVQTAYTTAAQQQAQQVQPAVQQLQQQPQQQQQQQQPQAQQQPQPQPSPQQQPQEQQQQQQRAGAGNVLVTPPATGVFAPSDPVQRIPAKWLAQGGLPAHNTTAYNRAALIEKLADKFIPIDLNFPGLRIINYDPAIFTVEGFLSPQECEDWQQATEQSGCLQQSKIGAGNAAAAAGSVNVYGARRTSSSLLLDSATQAKAPALAAFMATMQGRAYKLLAHLDGGRSWGPPGQMPAGGQYCFESPQVARYTTGQHFLAHEDGFPPLLAASNGFQRHATLLLYLNDVQQGGATHFDHLGVSVMPRQGTALLFFPAYANGTPDARTLHTAQDAQDTKWVMQQWVARGYPTPKAVLKAVKVAALAGPERPVGADAAEAAVEPIEREVFKVVVSSGDDGYGKVPARKSRRPKKGSSGKKGFSRR